MNVDLHSLLSSIVKTIEAKDFYTAGHSDRVAGLVEKMAASLGLPQNEIMMLDIAAHLHDIGKVGIPDGLLMKSSRLNPEEYALMRRHTLIGYDILKDVKGFEKIAKCVLCHHEQPDGRGYPHGLREKDIPMGALLISAADSYDAMTTQRTYNRLMTPEHALREIRIQSGTRYAAFAVEALCGVIINSGEVELYAGSESSHL